MNTFLKIAKYIFTQNSLIKVPFYLIRAASFQMFKRITGRIISKKLFNGKQIFLFPHCNVSTMFVYTDIPDKKEILFIRNIIDKDTIFLDIGSNVGSYSIMLSDIARDVFAFEPHPFTSKRCKMNFLLNGISDKHVFDVALSDSQGETYFSDNQINSTINKIASSSEGNIKVPLDTLDNFAENNLGREADYFVKIDTEGFEKNVLKGGKFFFQNYNVKGIVFECFEDKKSDVFGLLKSYNYETIKLDDNNYYAKNNRK